MTNTTSYRAFISYSHADRRWSERLHRAMETYRAPANLVGRVGSAGPVPDRLSPVFRDRDDLSVAHSLSIEIKKALEASQFLVVLCSPEAARSKWVNQEIIRFKQLHGEGRVLAAIVAGDPASNDPSVQCFPQALLFRITANGELGTEPTEPIAADFRANGDGFRYGFLKIASALMGVRLDDLVQREAHRRTVRIRWITGVLAALVITFAGIAWEALRQRDSARVAQVEATRARDDAESLIELILSDLKNDVQAFGKLKSLTDIGQRAHAYYENQSVSDLSPDQLGRRARVLLMLGEADNLRGNLEAALATYQDAAATTREQLRRDPNNPQRIFDHAQSVFWVGYIAWQRGEADAAKSAFAQYYELATKLVQLDPGNDDWKMELKYANSNLGTVARDSGNPVEAERHFQEALTTSLELLARSPLDSDRILAAGQAYAWLEQALSDQLRFDDALLQRQLELELYDDALKANPGDTRLLDQQAIAHLASGKVRLWMGDLDSALAQANAALGIQQRLAVGDSESAERKESMGAVLVFKGEALYHLGRLKEATRFLEQGLSVGRALLSKDQNVAFWQRKLIAAPQWLLAKIAYAEQRSTQAKSSARAARETMQALLEKHPRDRASTSAFGLALQVSIDVGEQAETRWNEFPALFDVEDASPENILMLARSCLRTDQVDQAVKLLRRLSAAGYGHPDFRTLLDQHPDLIESISGLSEDQPLQP